MPYPHSDIEAKWQKFWSENQIFKTENPTKKTVLILHGWDGNSEENWFPWLKAELTKKGYTVFTPNLPNALNPDLTEQLNFLENYKHTLESDSIIIGHSLGAKLACHFVVQHGLKIGKLLLVGPSYEGQKYASQELTTTLEKYNNSICELERIATPTVAYLSDNDPYIELSAAKTYYSRIPGINIREFSGKGHFNADAGITEFPELLTDIFALERPKYYALDMFPYPSGAGLHVGHPKGYTATDIIARYKHAKGFNVLHPMGWDAFGLPAENYAIKTGTHPAITTAGNINRFREQLQKFGFSFDWSREVDTTDPEYFRWSQWIFLKLFEAGLAYESDKPINFCPSCKTGLANEEVVDGKCERCGTPVEKKPIRQWVLAITKYADRLLSDIDRLDWPEGIKEQQRNWIGKSEGCQFFFRGIDCPDVEVFTTRIDTVYSGAFIVIAPDHPRVNEYIHTDQKVACEEYINQTREETDIERTNVQKEKTGVFTGSYAMNPYDGSKLPIWIGDFVLGHYGTGAVFGDAHDERDFVFAKKYGISLKQSIAYDYTFDGIYAPRSSTEILNRKTIDVILENEKGEIFLISEHNAENDTHAVHFIGGGIEDGENEQEAILKEIQEESGYTDVEIIAPVEMSYIYSKGYRHTKNKNQYTLSQFWYVKLKSETRVSCEIEAGRHSGKWYPKDQVEALINWGNHKLMWQHFIHGAQYAMVDDGILVNSGEYDSLTSAEARKVLTEKAEKEGFGKKVTNYKLRDWIFSRQRYWGEPIPLIHIKTPGLSNPNPGVKAYRGSSCIIEDEKGNFYFQRRPADKKFPNEIAFFGGGAENDEVPEETVIREVEEELELKLQVSDISFIGHGETIAGGDGIASLFYTKIDTTKTNLVCHEGEIEIYSAREFEQLKMLPTIRSRWEQFKAWREAASSLPFITTSDFTLAFPFLDDKNTGTMSLDGSHSDYFPTSAEECFIVREEKYDGTIGLFRVTKIINEKEFEWVFLGKLYPGIDSWLLPDYSLPLKLPEVERYEPSGDGQSPLATIPDWVNVRLGNNLVGKRETNTMPQWAGSCWYYLRYMDPYNSDAIVDPEVVKYWGEVDSYIGGAEHAVLHLLYARFWHKFLFDIGVVPTDEPFFKLRNVGLILGPDGNKMSKSKGNVINPDEVIAEYGSDTLRLYEMGMADFSDVAPWNTQAIIGSYRLLERIYRIFSLDSASPEAQNFLADDDMKAIKMMHKTIKKVGEDIENLKFNTAIAQINIMINQGMPRDPESQLEWKTTLAQMIHPFAPHMAEECWEKIQNTKYKIQNSSIFFSEWPDYIPALTIDDEVQIAIQINGKLRGTYPFLRGVTAEEVRMTVESKPEIAKWLEGVEIVKEIFIPNKILNIVVK